MEILYEDAHLVVVNKPSGIPTQGAGESLESLVRLHLQSGLERTLYLGTVHRLDKPVSGVIAWAKTLKAARRIAAQFADRGVQKEYWALVDPVMALDEGRWEDWLRDDETTPGRVTVGRESDSGTRLALTTFHCCDRGVPAWLILRPETGRTHQLRIQCASRGMPILGDARYGSATSFPVGIALHARRLIIRHPMIERTLEIVAEVPASWDAWRGGRW